MCQTDILEYKYQQEEIKKLTYGAEEAPKTGRIFTLRHPVVKKK